MARTPFQPDAAQRAALDQLARLARRRAKLDAETDAALLDAAALNVPKKAIAEAHGADWETVARRLAKLTPAEQLDVSRPGGPPVTVPGLPRKDARRP
ncbi:hypothetical protein E1258_09625 [Micromonospora sp. KC207]|uniref:hypothetical protein n=1 Tax=Micromonospora sp. KC207 TaxID=2530377 RepID=UPI00104EDB2B|nr:hypothetical protein [Micromonospora sp. KC207]TDC63895.1 hypothetical protein E1258_09625 [Micromonospora sp. KC207]